METSSSTTEGPLLLETILYSTSTTSSPGIISETLDELSTSTAASLAAAAASSSEEISSSTTVSSLLEDDGESFLIANISSTISSLTSLEDDDSGSNEMFADKIAGDYDVTSPLRVPKYFQAIITLFVCATLLICTIGIIKQVRLLCHKSSCNAAAAKIPLIRVSSAKDGSDDDGLDSVLVENGKSKKDNQSSVPKRPGDRHFDYYSSSQQQGKDASVGNGSKNEGDNEDLLKLKKVRFVRRVSGPFSDEAMDFAGATYKTDPKDAPYLSKEKSKSSKKIEPQIKFGSIRKSSQPTIPSSSLPQSAPTVAPPRPPPKSSSPPPPPPPRSSPPPL